MAEKHAIIIAVEKYQDRKIQSVLYAENDAKEFASVIEQHGFENLNLTLLINEHATKTRIESTLRTILRRLEKDDILFIFSQVMVSLMQAGTTSHAMTQSISI